MNKKEARKDAGAIVGKFEEAEGNGVTLVEAVCMALAYELEHNESVVVFGEDIGKNGGVFRATLGLQERFGEQRVFDTPLAENMLAGITVGMATQGLRPVVEFQFSGFMYAAVEQLECHASRLRTRTCGRMSVPAVFRAPYGGGVHAPEHHSESKEAFFTHMPGVRVVIPSSPRKAYGLLLAAIRDPDPVIFLEPKRIYRSVKKKVADCGKALPLSKSFVLKESPDSQLTLVSWGASIKETMLASEKLAQKGIKTDVIDVATLGSTCDFATILSSLEKTNRCIVVHEASLTGGFGAEIAARLADEGITSLLAPIKRVTGYDIVMPLACLEHIQIPTVDRILAAAKESLSYK